MKISLVIPCYNEENRLSISEFASFYAARRDIFLCFINDGSSDNTLSLLKSLAVKREDRVSVLSLPANRGKAEAVRAGVLHELRIRTVDSVGFLDADLATPLEEVDRLIFHCTDFPASQIVFGSRMRRPGARIIRSPLRHYAGRLFAAASELLMGIPAYDTQCGAKLIRASAAGEIFREPFISRWLFDVELFLRAAALTGGTTGSFLEVPLTTWVEKGSSRIGVQDTVVMMRDFIEIWRRYGRAGSPKKRWHAVRTPD